MDLNTKLLFISFSIMGFLQIGTCLKCYSCVGTPVHVPHIPNMPPEIKTVSQACFDPFRGNELQDAQIDCDNGISTCMKIDIRVGDVKVVMRGCLPPQTCDVFKDCRTCSGDLCNSSPTILPSVFIIGLISLLLGFVHL